MLMTGLSACIGLLPGAVSTGIGSQVQRPLAVVVVASMFIGPVMLLVVAPALQVMFLGQQPDASLPQDGQQRIKAARPDNDSVSLISVPNGCR